MKNLKQIIERTKNVIIEDSYLNTNFLYLEGLVLWIFAILLIIIKII